VSAGHGRRAQHLDAVALGEAGDVVAAGGVREPFRTMSEELMRRLAERGHPEVRFAHGSVFQFLDDDGTRVSVLAERVQVIKQAMAQLVAQHGYVERVPDPADGRAKLVRATGRGRAVFAIARELVAEVDARLEARLGTDKLRQLRALLQELGDVL
jgi:DNA-binding MarR family transcriptional regulator